jgi:t-SNARE complex subunit (syntaxin)
MAMNQTLSDYEKGKATIDYYQQLSDINSKQKQIDVFAKSLNVISEGHQKLYESRAKMTTKEMKELLTQYASDIQDLISEFNKSKKSKK